MFHEPLACLDKPTTLPDRAIGLAVLGATGSIGRQTLDIVARQRDRFRVVALSVNRRVEDALELCRQFNPRYLAVCDTDKAETARRLASEAGIGTQILSGEESLIDIVTLPEVDMVVTATVGYSGLLPTFAAIKAGKDIALANKETLVVGGDFIRTLMKASTSRIFPVDSEHSALAQCLAGEDLSAVSRLIITASGGPFRTLDAAKLRDVRAADALCHPNWDMGAKITIDSATMMNKAFEIIEAHYLYGLPGAYISAVVHPQSIVHSMVEFRDGALKAQLGIPDMHIPIAYALGMNTRFEHVSRPLSLADYSELTFERPDTVKFPCLNFASYALEHGGNTACVINAANEIAVEAFLHDNIAFTEIPEIIEKTLAKVAYIADPRPEDFVETNRESRAYAGYLIERI